jgi:hypothetical protein
MSSGTTTTRVGDIEVIALTGLPSEDEHRIDLNTRLRSCS